MRKAMFNLDYNKMGAVLAKWNEPLTTLMFVCDIKTSFSDLMA